MFIVNNMGVNILLLCVKRHDAKGPYRVIFLCVEWGEWGGGEGVGGGEVFSLCVTMGRENPTQVGSAHPLSNGG
jgi:hypothetical protein